MFAVTKLGRDSQDFLGYLSANNKSRSTEVSLALARIIAYKLQMPSAPVDSIILYFKTSCQMDVEFNIGAINELAILDLQTILDYTLKFYQFRYESIFAGNYICAIKRDSGIVDFFGISKYFDEVSLKAIQENPIAITDLVNKFNRVLDELKGNTDEPKY